MKFFSIITALFLIVPCLSAQETKDISLLLELGDFEKAEAAIQELKSPGERSLERGKLFFYKGDYLQAAKETGLAENTPDNRKLQNFFIAMAESTKNMISVESAHFIFKANEPEVFLSTYALTALETAYSRIGESIGYFPQDRIIVELYGSKDEFAAASTLGTKLLEKSGTVGICKFNRIMLLSPQALPVGFRWLDTLAHEYTHFIVNRRSMSKCPLWLHEGIARYHDTLWRLDEPLYLSPDGENHLFEARKNKKLITFKRMHPSIVFLDTQDDISLAFAEVSSAVKFMKESRGNDIVGKLLQELAAAKDERAGFRKALGTGQEGFESEWKKYLAGLPLRLRSGAMTDQPRFASFDENEFIGADIKGNIRLGDKLRRSGLYEASAAEYEKALERQPDNAVVLLKAARAYMGAGQAESAERKLLAAVEANPGYVTPFQQLGEFYLSRNSHAEAAAMLSESVAINPFYPSAHEQLAASYSALGLVEKARMELNILDSLKKSAE